MLEARFWDTQKRIVESLWSTGRTVVPASFGCGKTYAAARIALAWLETDPEAVVVTTATTWMQVEKQLWGEIRKAWKPILAGKLAPKAPDLYITPTNWALGLSVVDPVNMQGWHEGRVLVIADEAGGIEPPIFDAIQGLVAGGDSAILAIGNPIESSGPFFDLASNPRWDCIPISAFDTPNLNAPVGEIPYPKLVTREWVEERRLEWGEDDPRWISKVLGQFPSVGTRIVIPLAWFDAVPTEIIEFGPRDQVVMGLDCARFGTDDSAICIRRGPQILHLERTHGADGVQVGGWASNRAREYGVNKTYGDSGGLGGPILDFMRSNGMDVVDVNAGSATSAPEEFVLLRDELWWGLRDRFRDVGKGALYFHPDVDANEKRLLRSQATALFYNYDIRGRVKVESKADAKKRGIPSPDVADAACLAFYGGGGGAASYFMEQLIAEKLAEAPVVTPPVVREQRTGFPVP